MLEIHADMKSIIAPGGALNTLNQAVRNISDILAEHLKSHEEHMRHGHYGLPGEFGNGIGITMMFAAPASKDISPDSEGRYDGINRSIERLFQTFRKPSQLANSGISGFEGETAGAAIPRSITEAREWAENCTDLTDKEQTVLNESLQVAEEQFEIIRAFVQKHGDKAMAPTV